MPFSAGKNAVVKLDAAPGGTLTDYSAYAVNLETSLPVDLLDTTTFGDDFRDRIPGLKDFEFSVDFLADPTITAVIAGYVANQSASSTISFELAPEGNTASSGALKLTGECYCEGLPTSSAVDGVVTLKVTFRSTGAVTIGTY